MAERTDYQKVAELYMEAVERRENSSRYIADRLGITPQQAAQAVFRARHIKRLLPPAPKQGLQVGRTLSQYRVATVAHELGVDQDDLLSSLRRHAGGDGRWFRVRVDEGLDDG